MCNEKIWTPIKMVIDEPVQLIKRIYLSETRRKVGHRACSYDQMLLLKGCDASPYQEKLLALVIAYRSQSFHMVRKKSWP